MTLRHPRLNIIDRLARQLGRKLQRASSDLERHVPGSAAAAQAVQKATIEAATITQAELTKAYPQDAVVFAPEAAPRQGWWVDVLGAPVHFSTGRDPYGLTFAWYKGGRLEFAAIYLPTQDALYAVSRGEGAWGPRQRLRLSDSRGLVGPHLVAVQELTGPLSWPADITTVNSGWPLFDLLGVANQHLAAAIVAQTHPVVSQIAALFMLEAGGQISDLKGQPLTEASTAFVAANSKRHNHVLKVLSAASKKG